jgi:Rps23 Pro-64 3,4-dihydroxylase Tpa1-like proline 4-hydroxylase|tara:strand:+ start:428 stop:1027 length:600 start_codon:yes stop_codon:yes gene_type:complete
MEQKNFSLTDHIFKINEFLDYRVLTKLMKYINKLDAENKFGDAAIIGEGGIQKNEFIEKKIRNTNNYCLTNLNDSKTDQHWCNFLLAAFRKACRHYNKQYEHLRVSDVTDIQILKYPVGGHYIQHTDDHFNISRTLSFIYRLNNDFEGGDLVFNDRDNEMMRLKPEPNSLVVWPSNFLYPHGVEPVTKGVRWSIVAWAR